MGRWIILKLLSIAFSIVDKRVKITLTLVKDKKMLDIGCTGSTPSVRDKNYLTKGIHAKIAKVAKKAVGIDIFKEGIEKLKMGGFDVEPWEEL